MKKKYQILLVFIFSFLLVSFLTLLKTPNYEANATFFEENEKSQTIGNLKDIVLSESSSKTTDASSFFKSQSLSKKLVEKLALQIVQVEEKTLFQRLKEIFIKNYIFIFKKQIIENKKIEFVFSKYSKQKSSFYNLKILSKNSFELSDENCKNKINANTYEDVQLKDFSFKIKYIPKSYVNQTIKLRIDPWIAPAAKILKDIKITKEKTSPNFLYLKIKHQDRNLAAKILNILMDLYQEHLKDENEVLIKKQIQYLISRKENLEKELFSIFDEYEKHLSSNIRTKGFVNLNQEINSLVQKKENSQKKLNEVTQEIKQLNEVNINHLDKNTVLDKEFIDISDQIKRFKTKKTILQKSIQKDIAKKISNNSKPIAIEKILAEKYKIDDLITQVNKNNLFLMNKTKKYNPIYSSGISKQSSLSNINFSLLDLNSANDLYIQLNKTKDAKYSEISKIEHILEKLNDSNFQISNLSPYISSEAIQNIHEILKKLGDSSNYTSKEIEHFQKIYDLEKKYIKNHLEEVLNLQKLDLSLLNEKIYDLKKVQLNLLSNEISFLVKKAKNVLSKKIDQAINEKNNLEKALQEIKQNLHSVVKKLSQEKKIHMKSDLTKNMIDSITKLIESKQLDLNLKKISSKPVDFANTPTSFASLYLFRNSIIASFFATFIFFILCIYIAAIKGFALSAHILRVLSFDFSGEISFKCDGLEVKKLKSSDLESLRKVISSIDLSEHKIISTITSKGPNYIHYLAALLTIIGQKVLVVETTSELDEKQGVFSFLEDPTKKIPIKKLQAYDYLPSGGNKYFAFELLKSANFLEILQQLKSKYDLILIYSDADITSAEARIYLDFSDKIILSFKEETLHDIKRFIKWDKEKSKLSFVTY